MLFEFTSTSSRGCPLNKTNLRILKGLFGDPVSGWDGKIIVVFPVLTEMGPGLRVRRPPPKQVAQAAGNLQQWGGSGSAGAACRELQRLLLLWQAAPPWRAHRRHLRPRQRRDDDERCSFACCAC